MNEPPGRNFLGLMASALEARRASLILSLNFPQTNGTAEKSKNKRKVDYEVGQRASSLLLLTEEMRLLSSKVLVAIRVVTTTTNATSSIIMVVKSIPNPY